MIGLAIISAGLVAAYLAARFADLWYLEIHHGGWEDV